MLYILDTNTLSTIFRFYYRNVFVTFWSFFDRMVAEQRGVSVRQVQRELEERSDTAGAVDYLMEYHRQFFADNSPDEQRIIREMINNPNVATAVSRWISEIDPDETTRADPYLIAKAKSAAGPTTLVTEESQDPTKTAGIPYVCGQFNVRCINLQQMMAELGWQF